MIDWIGHHPPMPVEADGRIEIPDGYRFVWAQLGPSGFVEAIERLQENHKQRAATIEALARVFYGAPAETKEKP